MTPLEEMVLIARSKGTNAYLNESGELSFKKYQRKDISDKQVCIATYKKSIKSFTDPRFIYDFLHEMTGAPIKVCYRAMERACNRDFIEYGVSLRTAWLTEKGKDLISEIIKGTSK